MITRTSLANEIDEYDQQIADMNSGKKDCYDAYRDQLIASGMAKPNIKSEIEAVKAAIKRRRAANKDFDALEEKDALIDEIFGEITAAPRAPRATRENIEQFDRETGELSPRLVKQIVDGMQTEAGRAALVAAVDIMIEGVEAEENQESAGSLQAADTSLTTRDLSPSVVVDGQPPVPVHTNSEIAPASQGEAEAHATDERRAPGFDDRSGEGANTGGDHVNHEATSGRGFVKAPTAHKPLRPLCLRPEACGGYGDKTCHSCLVAARTTGEAA